MRFVNRFIVNYIILIVCLLLPLLVVIFGSLPDRLDFDIETNSPVSIQISFMTRNKNGDNVSYGKQMAGCVIGDSAPPTSFYLADGGNINDLKATFFISSGSFVLKRVTVLRHLLFRTSLSGYEFVNGFTFRNGQTIECLSSGAVRLKSDANSLTISAKEKSNLRLSFDGVELPSLPGVSILARAVMVGLAFIAIMGIFVKPHKKSATIAVDSLIIAVAGALLFTVVFPLQLVLGNRFLFNFPITQLLSECTILFFVVSITIFVLLQLSSIGYAHWFHVAFTAVIVYEYLETGILSAHNPSLDGGLAYYAQKAPAIRDMVWMIGIGFSMLVAYRWIKNYVKWIAIVVLMLAVASLFDVHSAAKGKRMDSSWLDASPWRGNRANVAHAIEFSPIRNVIVLILDSMQSDAAYEVMQNNPSLRDQFDGFVAFNNNVGMHEYTTPAFPAMMTGAYCPDGMNHVEFMTTSWSTNSFVTQYADAGLPVYVLPGILGCAYSNRLATNVTVAVDSQYEAKCVFLRRTKEVPYLNLMDYLRFQMVPFVLKFWSLRVSSNGVSGTDGTDDERSLYPLIGGSKISEEQKTALILIHTEGCHAPLHFDSNGNRIWRDRDTYAALYGQTHFMLKCVAGLMDTLKEKKVYDKSMVIIAGDHGLGFSPPKWSNLLNLPSRAIPVLWVKPINSVQRFDGVNIPTSHANISLLIKKAMAHNLSNVDVEKILYSNRREYRHGRTLQFKKYFLDANNNITTE